MKRRALTVSVMLALALLVNVLMGDGQQVQASPVSQTQAISVNTDAEDWDLPSGGHYFTQTGGGASRGFSVTDEGGIGFWSEFNRLGGVQSVGYPVSRRFQMNGFVCQAMQRVIFQWNPSTNSVSFMNVFDLMHEKGYDRSLKTQRQVPEPLGSAFDAGLDWNGTVNKHLALLEANPAIKAQYYAVDGDPVQIYGLPVSVVTDMGNNYAIRCQRVVIQQWKEETAWAHKDQVTVANGGDISKETGLVPVVASLATLPAINSCSDVQEYVTYGRAAAMQVSDSNKGLNINATMGLVIWETPNSDSNKATFERLTPWVISEYSSLEAELTTLKQDLEGQTCVPVQYAQTHKNLVQCVQKEIEATQLMRVGFTERNTDKFNQGVDAQKAALDLLLTVVRVLS